MWQIWRNLSVLVSQEIIYLFGSFKFLKSFVVQVALKAPTKPLNYLSWKDNIILHSFKKCCSEEMIFTWSLILKITKQTSRGYNWHTKIYGNRRKQSKKNIWMTYENMLVTCIQVHSKCQYLRLTTNGDESTQNSNFRRWKVIFSK